MHLHRHYPTHVKILPDLDKVSTRPVSMLYIETPDGDVFVRTLTQEELRLVPVELQRVVANSIKSRILVPGRKTKYWVSVSAGTGGDLGIYDGMHPVVGKYRYYRFEVHVHKLYSWGFLRVRKRW